MKPWLRHPGRRYPTRTEAETAACIDARAAGHNLKLPFKRRSWVNTLDEREVDHTAVCGMCGDAVILRMEGRAYMLDAGPPALIRECPNRYDRFS